MSVADEFERPVMLGDESDNPFETPNRIGPQAKFIQTRAQIEVRLA
jgi:hypothetical protein